MTSEKKIAANRKNAQKSSGPKTRAGKERVRLNALRHGLSTIAHNNPKFLPEIERIAQAICGEDKNPQILAHARKIAKNELILRHVRTEGVAVVERSRDARAAPVANALAPARTPDAEQVELQVLRDSMPSLTRLIRYERRAWSGRTRALRKFTAIKAGMNCAPATRSIVNNAQAKSQDEATGSAASA